MITQAFLAWLFAVIIWVILFVSLLDETVQKGSGDVFWIIVFFLGPIIGIGSLIVGLGRVWDKFGFGFEFLTKSSTFFKWILFSGQCALALIGSVFIIYLFRYIIIYFKDSYGGSWFDNTSPWSIITKIIGLIGSLCGIVNFYLQYIASKK